MKSKTPKVVILDDNELSIMSYAEEYPENWKKICKALDKRRSQKYVQYKSKRKTKSYEEKERKISERFHENVSKLFDIFT